MLHRSFQYQIWHSDSANAQRPPDSHYVSAPLKYVREFSICYRESMLLIPVDDKHIIPVGEPNCPEFTGVRGHNCSIVSIDRPQVQALDHDSHVRGIVVPAFFVDVPEDDSGTFFRGHAFVTNKNKLCSHHM